jgi:hypothetical protein
VQYRLSEAFVLALWEIGRLTLNSIHVKPNTRGEIRRWIQNYKGYLRMSIIAVTPRIVRLRVRKPMSMVPVVLVQYDHAPSKPVNGRIGVARGSQKSQP